jgi:hypothetical protein
VENQHSRELINLCRDPRIIWEIRKRKFRCLGQMEECQKKELSRCLRTHNKQKGLLESQERGG